MQPDLRRVRDLSRYPELRWLDRFDILVPVLMPVILKVGIDPVHFGVMMTLNLMIGLLHPPLGMVLFVLSRIAKLSIERTTMAILPWLIPLLLSLIAITMIPELTLWLPRVVGLVK